MSEVKVTRKPKYDGRTKKRQWEDRRSDKGAGLDPTLPKLVKIDEMTTAPVSADKIKRRKFALLMGYSGAHYYGMQRNPNTKTIEEDLFKALFDAGFINEDCYTMVQNMQFQRAARTDKGVSAARQVVSLKLGENFNLAKVNELLCDEIRIFGFKRVTKGFNSKSQCDGRTYVYILPTVSFVNNNDLQQKGFRLPEEIHKKVNEILQMYVGTKNFHNFTVKKKPNDPSAKRFIKSFECETPFVKDDVEFCVLKIYGQSFMMHQIRKMIGLVLAVMRGLTGPETIEKALSSDEKVNVPRAPGLGLLLDYVHYVRYNHRYGTDGMHDKLTWEDVEKDVEEFKEKMILPIIINTEINETSMLNWLENKLSRHSYDDEEKDESDDEGGAADDDEDDQVVTSNQDITKDIKNNISKEKIDKEKATE
ncbi:pseudouridylate synthase 1 homolog isoform X2 [Anthonomus grandis grandis]|nr:pseudouridylate synthase 1 homolog isoform X2 [Anthonomus grandis grandis]